MNEDHVSEIIQKSHKAPAYHYLFFDEDSIKAELFEGFQDVEKKMPVDSNTTFYAFSVTKTLTAVAAIQLVQNGRVELDDEITKHLPEYVFSQPVTIRNLLSHQSGISNPLPLKWIHPRQDHAEYNFSGFADAVILENLKLKRTPGKKYSYSNVNYLVLGQLIEKISGVTYQEYIIDTVLKKVNTDDYFGFDWPQDNYAKGYFPNTFFQNIVLGFLMDKKKYTYKVNDDWSGFKDFYVNGASYGGLICSPRVLMKFCLSLMSDKTNLLERPKIDDMFTEQLTNKGKSTGMGLGWFVGTLNGEKYVCHAGGGGGYYCEIRIYPELNRGSIIMTNSTGMTDKRLLDKLDVNYLTSLK